ncbi:MAG: NAD(P)H-hydrate dehydratase, partial [Burkholderiaceae bacterium]
DAAGQVWWDDLGIETTESPSAWLLGADRATLPPRPHASHKGSYGDVAVLGGAPGMTGAALLAARAALHAGAGRVFVALLDGGGLAVDPVQPELMFRQLDQLDLRTSTIVCGCGGGDTVRAALPQVLSQSPRLVLDADALNAIAADTALQTLLIARSRKGHATLLTPHPLEAARLLACPTAQVQNHRLQAAQQLAERFRCSVILKGAGSVVAAPSQVPCINATGNAKLATAGTGDVLAGLCGAYLAAGQSAFQAACTAAHLHGQAADGWPAQHSLTASQLASTSWIHTTVGHALP